MSLDYYDRMMYSRHVDDDLESPIEDEEDEEEEEDEDTDEEEEEDSESDLDGGESNQLNSVKNHHRKRRRSSSRREYTEIKEQMYQDKLAELRHQLTQLNEGNLPEYLKKLRRLEQLFKERIRINGVIRDLEVEMVEQDFINEKKMSAREFEDHKDFLRENLIAELEEKQKMIEAERHNMELTGDSLELKPISTRKLRRRAPEPTNSGGYGRDGDKRRKPNQLSSMTYQLDEGEILEDLKIINKNKAFSVRGKVRTAPL